MQRPKLYSKWDNRRAAGRLRKIRKAAKRGPGPSAAQRLVQRLLAKFRAKLVENAINSRGHIINCTYS